MRDYLYIYFIPILLMPSNPRILDLGLPIKSMFTQHSSPLHGLCLAISNSILLWHFEAQYLISCVYLAVCYLVHLPHIYSWSLDWAPRVSHSIFIARKFFSDKMISVKTPFTFWKGGEKYQIQFDQRARILLHARNMCGDCSLAPVSVHHSISHCSESLFSCLNPTKGLFTNLGKVVADFILYELWCYNLSPAGNSTVEFPTLVTWQCIGIVIQSSQRAGLHQAVSISCKVYKWQLLAERMTGSETKNMQVRS